MAAAVVVTAAAAAAATRAHVTSHVTATSRASPHHVTGGTVLHWQPRYNTIGSSSSSREAAMMAAA
jgi:hypothetical protein